MRSVCALWSDPPVRLVSLDYDHAEEARADLDALAEGLRASGCSVEITGADEPHRVRLQKGVEHIIVDMLSVVLDEAERHLIDTVLTVLTTWALHRRVFRGREGSKPMVVVWIDAEVVREAELPEADETPIHLLPHKHTLPLLARAEAAAQATIVGEA